MFPSKVIFSQKLKANTKLNELAVEGFDSVFSPKHTLDELLSEILLYVQKKVKEDPDSLIVKEAGYNLKVQQVEIQISNTDDMHLSTLIDSKGRIINFLLNVEYSEVLLVGYLRENYLITQSDADPWNEYTEVIYMPVETGLTIGKIKLIK